jgi:hypothetical protein
LSELAQETIYSKPKPVREKSMKEEPKPMSEKLLNAEPDLADHPIGTGGIVVPIEKIHIEEQQPLSPKSEHQCRILEEELKQRSERFRKAKSDLAKRMESEEFKHMRWVKLRRKKGIPYLESPATLEAIQESRADDRHVHSSFLWNHFRWEILIISLRSVLNTSHITCHHQRILPLGNI